MTYEIAWADEAFAAAQAFMADDPAGLATVFDTVDDLASNPRPPTALPWGSTAFHRCQTSLRAGDRLAAVGRVPRIPPLSTSVWCIDRQAGI